ncbi:Long chain acyl-CoA synthetase 7, peroxisomal [Vitis vinifera]|uniref:Long chain acyl-CoA synthetase 7, peroxisomal n=1 Tax=Vitis vinifera TaxID=29760 RepID=A0A438F671_VITVI|nr:Long chain acyl-CoA synthetase 7, peroxisomal [Vitis vinifera]
MTYGEAGTARSAIGSGLIYYGIPKGSCVGLYFINRPEWLIVDHACSAFSYLLSFLSEIPSVRLIVVVGGIDDQMPSLPSTTGVEVVSYSKLLNQGRSRPQPFCPPKPDDVATICYTSGSCTVHGNLIANVAGATLSVKFYPSDVYISYLPLAHIYERANQVMTIYFGVAVGFYQGCRHVYLDLTLSGIPFPNNLVCWGKRESDLVSYQTSDSLRGGWVVVP